MILYDNHTAVLKQTCRKFLDLIIRSVTKNSARAYLSDHNKRQLLFISVRLLYVYTYAVVWLARGATARGGDN